MQPLILIASFPRSGNHLVRFFVEYVTGRATLGCRDNPDDLPIAENYAGDELHHVDLSNPIARKAHGYSEIRRGQKLEDYHALVFIRRDFVKALASHTREAKGTARARLWLRCVRSYMRIWQFYLQWRGPKIALRYEHLVSDRGREEIARLFDFLGDDADSGRRAVALANYDNLRLTFGRSPRPAWHRAFVSDVVST